MFQAAYSPKDQLPELQDTIPATVTGAPINDAITYFSDRYLEAGWRRVALMAKALQWGFNVLLTDVDVVWFQNPYAYIAQFPEVQLCPTLLYDATCHLALCRNGV